MMGRSLDDLAARLDSYWREWKGARPQEMELNQAGTLKTQYRVSDFMAWQREGALELNPNFQRRPVWKKASKSFLIDTILRNLPMPIIFLRDLRTDLKTLKAKREVVDGQQRIRTIFSFVDSTLVPRYNAERDDFTIDPIHNPEQGGKSFVQLDPADRQNILDYQFSVHSFPADTPDRLILQIFARMNATGVKLNQQEIRNAEYVGKFKTIAYEIATEQLERWRDDWGIFPPDQIARMAEVELTSEFMLLIINGVLAKNNKAIDAYYKFYNVSFDDGVEVARRFRATLDQIAESFEAATIKKLFKKRTLFFPLFACVYGLQYGLRATTKLDDIPRLKTREKPKPLKPSIVRRIIEAGAQIESRSEDLPDEVSNALRGATSDAGTRKTVIRFLVGKENDPCRHLN